MRALRRLGLAGAIVLAIATLVSAGNAIVNVPKTHAAASTPLCVQRPQMCTELADPWTWNGYTYTSGHDEPSALFYSTVPGSGNSNIYNLTLPKDPPTAPKQDGTGSTWDFQLRPTFWFGMIMCDDQDAPIPGQACTPDSDSNIYTSLDPHSPATSARRQARPSWRCSSIRPAGVR